MKRSKHLLFYTFLNLAFLSYNAQSSSIHDTYYSIELALLDIENAKEYGQYEFLQACQEMGIVKKDI